MENSSILEVAKIVETSKEFQDYLNNGRVNSKNDNIFSSNLHFPRDYKQEEKKQASRNTRKALSVNNEKFTRLSLLTTTLLMLVGRSTASQEVEDTLLDHYNLRGSSNQEVSYYDNILINPQKNLDSKDIAVSESDVNNEVNSKIQALRKKAQIRRKRNKALFEKNEQVGVNIDNQGKSRKLLEEQEENKQQINTYTLDEQSFPCVANLTDGGNIYVWTSEGQDGSGKGIFAQRYNSNNQKQGDEFQINTETFGDQSFPKVTGLKDGGFVAVWRTIDQENTQPTVLKIN